MAKTDLKPLIDHAIGALGDLSGDIGGFRQQLHSIKSKKTWSEAELTALRKSLQHMASLCSSTLEQWEEETRVQIP